MKANKHSNKDPYNMTFVIPVDYVKKLEIKPRDEFDYVINGNSITITLRNRSE